MATYGIDYSVLKGTNFSNYDLDLTFYQISGLDVLIEDIYKKITTPANLFWYIGGTIDIESFSNFSFTNARLNQLKKEIFQLFFDELRFSIDTVDVLFRVPSELYIKIQFIPSNDPNLKLTLELVSNSNEVKIVRVE